MTFVRRARVSGAGRAVQSAPRRSAKSCRKRNSVNATVSSSYRVAGACFASLVIYIAAFAFLLDRPLTLGGLRARIEANLAFGATINEPKLVILAGSNGPYSHRCETIEPILHRPCVNAGVAVGIGLDYLFTRWKPLLHPGDIVYLPLEETQYTRRRSTVGLGPDAAIMLRHDRPTLWSLPLSRQVAALFASDLRAAIMSLIETALSEYAFHDPREAVIGSTNASGDHIGHTAVLAALNRSGLAKATQLHPSSAQIDDGYGTTEVIEFLGWASSHNVRAIGGLPTGFADLPMSAANVATISAIYREHAAEFLELPNRSRYPRNAFFDTPDHLNEPAQIQHSAAIAWELLRLTGQSGQLSSAPLP